MPECQDSCIQQVAAALTQQLQAQTQVQTQPQVQVQAQAQTPSTSCPTQCQPGCRPSCVQSVISQQAQQTVPLPTEAVSCPAQCQPSCQPSCLLQQQSPSYLTPGLQQSSHPTPVIMPSPSNIPAGMVAPSVPVAPAYSVPSQTGHLQSGHDQNKNNKFSMLTNKNQPIPTQNTPSDGKPKTCISACMPLCLDECVNAGMDTEKQNKFDNREISSEQNKKGNFSNNNQQFGTFAQMTTTTQPPRSMPNNFAFNVVDGQGSGQPAPNEKPMRVSSF